MTNDLASLLNKTILIGITRVDAQGEVVDEIQMHGVIEEASMERFSIRLSSGENYTLPPHYGNVFHAKPGEYRLRSTGEVVINPDYTATWTVHAPRTE